MHLLLDELRDQGIFFFSLYKAYAAEEAAGPARFKLFIARGDTDETDLGWIVLF